MMSFTSLSNDTLPMTLTHIRKTSLYTNRNIEKVGACTANTDNKLYSNVSYVGPSSECLDSL